MPADTVYVFDKTSPEDLEVIRTTLPLVAKTGPAFTKHFYKILFQGHPELKNLFNQTNQAKGKQPQKLLATVALAAQTALETGQLPGEAIEGICQKHAALGVPAEAYAVVGANILQTIRDLLTDDPAVLAAWGHVYADIADAFTTREAEIYDETVQQPGSWKGRRKFTLKHKEAVSTVITRFTFAPVDGGAVPALKAGTFTTIWVPVPEDTAGPHGSYKEQPRHYTLAAPRTPDEEACLSISVKADGLVSHILHKAEPGTEWDLSAPFGCFHLSGVEQLWLSEPEAPIVFLSAGVGITPVLAMLENIPNTRTVSWLHGARDGRVHAYRDRLCQLTAVRQGNLQRRVWYSHATTDDGPPAPNDNNNTARYHFAGRMNLADVNAATVLHSDQPHAQYFMCGPTSFMETQTAFLTGLGVSADRIHSEGF